MPDERPALLVVSPDVGLDTIGGERIRKLTAAFDDEGWRVVGLAPPERDYLTSLAQWPASLVVHRTFDANPWTLGVFLKRRLRSAAPPAPTPHGADTGRSGVGDGGLAVDALRRVWPYPWAGWVPFAVARGVAVARDERASAIFSSFSPTASHVVAGALHRLTGLPWIADFRDPWTWGARHGYIWARDRAVNRRAEAAVLRGASALTTIGPSLGAELAERASREVVVLPHGIPSERVEATSSQSDRLELVYAGTVDAWSADLTPVLRALLRLAIPARLTLVGPIEHRAPELERAIERGLVDVRGKVSRQEAQRVTAASDVALLVQKRPSRIWVTTKLWDYLASRTPILVAASECDAADIVRETRTGWVVPYADEDAIVRVLQDAYGHRGKLWDPDEEALGRYGAAAISRRFVALLNELRQ